MRKYIFCLLCLIVQLFCFSKTYGQLLYAPQQSQTAQADAKYYDVISGQNMVEDFSGSKLINIPLFEFSTQGKKVPVSLTYKTNGVKLGDISKWVGLNWNLNYSGFIAREVRDIADEKERGSIALKQRSNGVWDLQQRINDITNNNDATNAQKLGLFYVGDALNEKDKEPDIFSYSINGRSGKFIVDQDMNVKLIPYQNIKVIPSISNSGQYEMIINGFTIIDDNGMKFYFDLPETTLVEGYGWAAYTGGVATQNYAPHETEYVSGWYLSKIVTPVRYMENSNLVEKSIQFTYENESYGENLPGSVWARSCGDCEENDLSLFASGSPNAIIYSGSTVTAKKIKSIEDDNMKAEFFYESSIGNSAATASILDFITITDKTTLNEIRTLNFIYHTYAGTHDDNFLGDSHDNNQSLNRIMLTRITQARETTEGRESELLCEFQYNESATMPSRYSFQQDFWGYYNGKTTNTTIFPSIHVYPDAQGITKYTLYPKAGNPTPHIVLAGADREPNPSTISLGALTRIKYKTGGHVSFEYEPNDFYMDGANRLGPGIRIKKTTVHDGINQNNDIVKEFSYRKLSDPAVSSGLIINMPVFGAIENSHYNISSFSPSDIYQTWYYQDCYVRTSNSVSNSPDGQDIGYSEITEKNADNSKTWKKFSVPGHYLQLADDQPGVNCSLDTEGYCDGLFVKHESKYCADGNFSVAPDLMGYDFPNSGLYPYHQDMNYDWNRGLLLEVKQFDADNFVVQSSKYKYKLFYPNGGSTPGYVGGLVISKIKNWKVGDLFFFTKYKTIADVAKVLEEKTEKRFDKAHPGHSSELITTYQYGGYNHTEPTKITEKDSKGVDNSVELMYSFDLLKPSYQPVYNYPNVYPQRGFVALVDQNINTVIQKIFSVKPNPTGGEFVKSAEVNYFDASILFQDHNPYNTITLKEGKRLNLKTPIARSSLTDNVNSNGFIIDSRYVTEVQYTRHDDYGNVLETSARDEKISVIMGYDKRYPIAEVTNANFNDIAYASFEIAGDYGNWQINGAAVSDNTVPMGNKCFNLKNGNVYSPILANNKKYILSYWSKNGVYQEVHTSAPGKQGITLNGWTYYEHEITGQNSHILFDNQGPQTDFFIDEIKLYPKNAQMRTYFYEPFVGVKSSCDIDNTIQYYEYYPLGKLKLVRDQNKNILKSFEYDYQVNP